MKMQSTLRDMVIKSFLKWVKFLGYWPISFKGYGLLFNLLKVIWDTSDPRVFPALNLMKI